MLHGRGREGEIERGEIIYDLPWPSQGKEIAAWMSPAVEKYVDSVHLWKNSAWIDDFVDLMFVS